MIKYIPLILLLLLSACSPAQAGKSKPTAAQAQAQGVMLELPTQAPATDTPAPTVDVPELIRRVNEAEQLAQEAISKKNEAVADKNSSDATANAANVRALEMTATLGAQGIERANIFGTQQVISATSNAAQIAQNSAFATQKKQAPGDAATATALVIAGKNADTAAKIEPLRSGVLAVSPLLVIAMIFFLAWVALSRPSRADPDPEPVTANEAGTAKTPAYPGGTAASLFTDSGITMVLLQAVADGLAAGKTLIHDTWTPAKENGFSEGLFTTFQHILVTRGLAVWRETTHKGGVELTERGVAFFAQLRTTPPPEQDVPVSAKSAGKDTIDSDLLPIPGRGGAESEMK
jgi:hypothetical protein